MTSLGELARPARGRGSPPASTGRGPEFPQELPQRARAILGYGIGTELGEPLADLGGTQPTVRDRIVGHPPPVISRSAARPSVLGRDRQDRFADRPRAGSDPTTVCLPFQTRLRRRPGDPAIRPPRSASRDWSGISGSSPFMMSQDVPVIHGSIRSSLSFWRPEARNASGISEIIAGRLPCRAAPEKSELAVEPRSRGGPLLQMLADAGFTEATIHGWTGDQTSSCTQGGLVTARKPDPRTIFGPGNAVEVRYHRRPEALIRLLRPSDVVSHEPPRGRHPRPRRVPRRPGTRPGVTGDRSEVGASSR